MRERPMGLLWGAMAGFCLSAGMFVEPKLILCTIFPLLGFWVFRPRSAR